MKPERLLALGVFLAVVTAAASLTAAQKPTPPPTEQQKLKERLDALDSQLKEANARADRAAMEKDYVEHIQKEAKNYYDKVLNTQTWTLGIVGLIITIVSAATARFGLTIFDRHIEQAVSKATTDLETKFDKKLAAELKTLEDSNAAQMKRLEDDLHLRSDFQFYFASALAAGADNRADEAKKGFRTVVQIYKLGKARCLFQTGDVVPPIHDIFVALRRKDEASFTENAKKELADPLYNGLQDELARVALKTTDPDLGRLIAEREQSPPLPTTQGAPPATTPEKAHSGTAPAPPIKPTTK